MTLLVLIEVAIGLALVYFLASTLCSGIIEAAAHNIGWRGKFLRLGLVNLLSDRWIYLRVINHPLLASLYRNVPGKIRHPAYIPGETFAQALIDVIVHKAAQITGADPAGRDAPLTVGEVRAAASVCRSAGFTVGEALLPLIEQAGDDLNAIRTNVGVWYDHAMDRVAGWYKLRMRKILLCVGFAVAVLCNVDTIDIVKSLVSDPALREAIADRGVAVAKEPKLGGVTLPTQLGEMVTPEAAQQTVTALQKFETLGLPLGFSCLAPDPSGKGNNNSVSGILSHCWDATKKQSTGAWLLKSIGWLITAVAISLGGPFWFDLLNRFADLRGAGRRPPPSLPGDS